MAEYEEDGGVTPSAPMERIATGEIMSQVEIAKRNPRNLAKFVQDLTALATSSEEVAKSCFYTLYRKDKEGGEVLIQGPSIHFTRLMAPLYKNLRWAGRQGASEEDSVVAQGAAHDLESNVYLMVEVRRPIVNRQGRRYSADMINTTTMAAISLALRNAMLGVISRPLWEPAFLAAKAKAVGTQKGLAQRRKKCVEEFSKMGVKAEEILVFVAREKIDQIDLRDLEKLIGTFNAIRDGAQNIDEAFGRQKPPREGAMSQAEAESQGLVTKGGPLEAALGGVKTVEDPSLEQEARAREAAEAAVERRPTKPGKEAVPPPEHKVDRNAVWKALSARAKEQNTTGGMLLHKLTGKSNMADLDNNELLALEKKLR